MRILASEVKTIADLAICDVLAYIGLPDKQPDGDFTCNVSIEGAIDVQVTIRTNNSPDCLFSALIFIETSLSSHHATKPIFFSDGSGFVPRLLLYADVLKKQLPRPHGEYSS